MDARKWLIGGCGLVVVAMCAAIYLAGRQTPATTYTPTGDELCDRFALLFLDQLTTRRGSLVSYFKKLSDKEAVRQAILSLDLSGLNTWEEEFGDRPEYWELRYVVNRDEVELLAAIDRGVVNAALFNLFNYFSMVTDNPEQALRLADAAISMDPENSYYYYLKANLLISLGEIPQARQALRSGNAAVRNEYPVPFARRMAEEHFLKAKDLDTRAVAGYSMLVAQYSHCMSFITYQSVANAIVDGESIEFANEWLTFRKRLALMDGSTAHEAASAVLGAQGLLGRVPKVIELTTDEQERVEQANADLGEANRTFGRWAFVDSKEKPMLDLIADSDYSLNKSVEVLSNRTPSNLDKGRLSEDLDRYIRGKEVLQKLREYFDALDLQIFDSESERP